MLVRALNFAGRWSDFVVVARGAQAVARSALDLAKQPGYVKSEATNAVQRGLILVAKPAFGPKAKKKQRGDTTRPPGDENTIVAASESIETASTVTGPELGKAGKESLIMKEKIAKENDPYTSERIAKTDLIEKDLIEMKAPPDNTVLSGSESSENHITANTEIEGADSDDVKTKSVETPTNRGSNAKIDQTNLRAEHRNVHTQAANIERDAHQNFSSAFENEGNRMQSAKEFRVPESSLSRAFGFGRLGAGLIFGAVSESARRSFGIQGPTEHPISPLLSDANAERIASSLSRMRGAALKVGQMLSIQDEKLIPPALMKALDRVRQSADYMPKGQLESMLDRELGSDWQSNFQEFQEVPIAAASIGQVHAATLIDGRKVAMKVQYPGVAQSIDSDLNNLKRLVKYSGMIPKTLYIDETMAFAREELSRECDYSQEAEHQRKFVSLIGKDDPDFAVPGVIDELSTNAVLTTEFAPGQPIDSFAGSTQHVRDRIGRLFLKLTLRELFEFRYMQTDPNFSNFLYDPENDKLRMLDFGAATSYPPLFVENYLRMVHACAEKNRDNIIFYGRELGFLVGEESRLMLDAHTAASTVVGEPFGTMEPYDFKASDISGRMARHGKDLVEHRLCPPPKEAYSLHRRLSGAFLMCMRLNAKFPCRDLFLDVYENYKFVHTKER